MLSLNLLCVAALFTSGVDGMDHQGDQRLIRRQGEDTISTEVVASGAIKNDAGADGLNDASANRPIYLQLQKELYNGVSPYKALTKTDWRFKPDWGFGWSNLHAGLVQKILTYTKNPKFWLELGSYVGNSAITTAQLVGSNTSVICMDPWTGDVNTWAWNKEVKSKTPKSMARFNFNFEEMDDDGQVRLYETFLTNVKNKNVHDRVLPIRITAMAGMRLLPRLVTEKRLDELPKVIYLDSAHEKDETYMEVSAAFNLVQSGGMVTGDDWTWSAVAGDVTRYAQEHKLPAIKPEVVKFFDLPGKPAKQIVDGVIIADGFQWLLLKP